MSTGPRGSLGRRRISAFCRRRTAFDWCSWAAVDGGTGGGTDPGAQRRKAGFILRQTPAFESSGAVRTPRERPLQTTPSSAFDAGARKTNGCVLLQSFQHCVYAACLSGLRGAGDTAIVRRPWTWKAKSVYLNGLAMPYRTCVFTKRKERDSIHVDC